MQGKDSRKAISLDTEIDNAPEVFDLKISSQKRRKEKGKLAHESENLAKSRKLMVA